jgi:hypothetical protein
LTGGRVVLIEVRTVFQVQYPLTVHAQSLASTPTTLWSCLFLHSAFLFLSKYTQGQ